MLGNLYGVVTKRRGRIVAGSCAKSRCNSCIVCRDDEGRYFTLHRERCASGCGKLRFCNWFVTMRPAAEPCVRHSQENGRREQPPVVLQSLGGNSAGGIPGSLRVTLLFSGSVLDSEHGRRAGRVRRE